MRTRRFRSVLYEALRDGRPSAVAATGNTPRALSLYQESLATNQELRKPDDEAAALEGIAGCLLTDGRTRDAARHLKQALDIYQWLAMRTSAQRVTERIAALGGSGG
jgi:tetratricopeptide (TPR) repeat protein